MDSPSSSASCAADSRTLWTLPACPPRSPPRGWPPGRRFRWNIRNLRRNPTVRPVDPPELDFRRVGGGSSSTEWPILSPYALATSRTIGQNPQEHLHLQRHVPP